MARLTAASVDRWKAAERRQEVPDDLLTGLYLIVQPSGKKGWQVRYRHGGKHRRMSLGKFPMIGLADARERAREVLIAAQAGRDPAGEVAAAKAAEAAEGDRERDTVRALIEQYDRRHLSKLRSGRQVRRELDRHIVERWGDRDVKEITRRDVRDRLDEIADAGRVVNANRLRSYLSGFFNWCLEREVIEASPVHGVRPVAREKARERVLSGDELRWLWQACQAHGQPMGPLVQLLILTGQRRIEVSQMAEAEIEGDTWHLSGDRTKNGKAHDVPLSEAAQAVLAGVQRIAGPAGYLFTTTGQTPVSGFTKARERLTRRMREIAAEERGEPVEIPHWTIHDLRRTAATGLARLGTPVRVTEAVLNLMSDNQVGRHRQPTWPVAPAGGRA